MKMHVKIFKINVGNQDYFHGDLTGTWEYVLFEASPLRPTSEMSFATKESKVTRCFVNGSKRLLFKRS